MADQKDAFQALSSENRGTLITLTSVSLLIVAIIFVAAKFGSAIYFKQRRTAVNTPIWAALILAIIQVVLLQKAVDHGLGRHQDLLSDDDIQTWSKFAYAAHILLIGAMSLSKMSTILLIWRLTPSKILRRSCAVATGIVVGWSIFAVLGIAFQFFNILTEVIIVVLPFLMMRNVQMAWHKRVKILCSFSARSSVVCLGIAHLALISSFSHSTDISWDIVNWEIIAQTMMLTGVITACVPTLYHIFAGLHSGLTTTQIPDGIGLELPRTKVSGYINQSSSGASQSARGRSMKNGRSMFDGRNTDGVVTEVSTGGNLGRDEGDRQSSSSEGAESTRHLTQGNGGVLRTVDVTVSVEKQDHRDRL
ncbi:hypothetical protein AO1008_07041 [Aspergillus oryzae 100-8]|uniref:Rhodopsin domain-containing protein n=1 Tax=Aspergillus oryzae (strain 3.042) TaxID=1160506 RepID=I8U1S2_ASPO3|nr:hypothetical protein Ao3042_03110 [Aspergillus oryzae 3.042]KDE80766.1 hypothetical protein AO1008_07041 [Aspergillus oryzae 100-8]|eukprot:EIT80598.1 hypothetical protein Ao3042_03110 [Aspergillus oryzae 3.042]